eukprot:7303538-Alexandrium_andersonii.AAC.1
MSASLVGSEMCIRDRRVWRAAFDFRGSHFGRPPAAGKIILLLGRAWTAASVSYTHLTLPTICSV